MPISDVYNLSKIGIDHNVGHLVV